MRDGDWLIGYGCATAAYPTHMGARDRAGDDERERRCARVESSGQDSGQGTYTVLAQIAARELGIGARTGAGGHGRLQAPAAPASALIRSERHRSDPRVKLATDKIRARFGGAMPPRDDRATAFRRLGVQELSELGEFLPPSTQPKVLDMLRKGQVPLREPSTRRRRSKSGKPLMFALSAHCLPRSAFIGRPQRYAVPRLTGAFAQPAGSSIRALPTAS